MDKYYGYDTVDDFIQFSRNKMVQNQMRYEGTKVLINGVPNVGIIRNNLNPMSEKKEERTFLVDYNTEISRGSYIEDLSEGDIYLAISDIDKHDKTYKKCKLSLCGQVIKLSKSFIVPCVVTSSSYGVKLNLVAGGMLSDSDTKIDVIVGVNEMTRQIKLDTRFILNSEEEGVYKIMDKKVIDKGLYTFTCEKDNLIKNLDDLENSIAYNSDKKPDVSADYTVHGESKIVVGGLYTYDITPKEGEVSFVFDEETVANGVAEIVSRTEFTVTIRALKPNTVITLNVIHNGEISGSKNIGIVRK